MEVPNVSIKTLLQLEADFNSEIENIKNDIRAYEEKLDEARILNESKLTRNNDTKRSVKTLRTKIIESQNVVNERIRAQEVVVADKVFDRILQLDLKKENGYLPDECVEEMKLLYLLLARQGRLNVRYLKLPKCWLKIGMYGGILEELIVILRTPSQTGIGDTHMHTISSIVGGFNKFLQQENDEGKPTRFLFLTKLVTKYSDLVVTNILCDCVKYQGESKRIGIYDDPETREKYLYVKIYPFASLITKF